MHSHFLMYNRGKVSQITLDKTFSLYFFRTHTVMDGWDSEVMLLTNGTLKHNLRS